jgi:hypothetical protein
VIADGGNDHSVDHKFAPASNLNHLAALIRTYRDQLRSRRRRLDPGRPALFALARLAAGFEIGVTTAWRYVREAIDLLAASADDLATAMNRIRLLAYAILDGTLIPIDRVADQKPYYPASTAGTA